MIVYYWILCSVTLFIGALSEGSIEEYRECTHRTTECAKGLACYRKNGLYSQCRKEAPRCGFLDSPPNQNCSFALLNEQCGGLDWTGPNKCLANLKCCRIEQYYSTCRFSCGAYLIDKCSLCVNGGCDRREQKCICDAGWEGEECTKYRVTLIIKIVIPIVVALILIEGLILCCYSRKGFEPIADDSNYIMHEIRPEDESYTKFISKTPISGRDDGYLNPTRSPANKEKTNYIENIKSNYYEGEYENGYD